ncbi:MAG: hypothetical protein PF503_10150 [Desulfobacula sp.]|jgi:hypothetical protein|nr:hypothetical protein [Desulfobacula sp.]
MARPKKTSSKTKAAKSPDTLKSKDKVEIKSTIQETEIPEENVDSNKTVIPVSEEVSETTDNETAIIILYKKSCQKLTSRGVGELQYEIGFDDAIDEAYLRITGNESSGAFSTKWIALSDIQTIIAKVENEAFRAVVLRDLYLGRSSNNHGYLGSVLKEEKVVAALPKQPTVLRLESWEPLIEKINKLKETDVNLPDTITKPAK